MNNPFDLDNYKPRISMKDEDTARKNSFQQTAVINRKRAEGVELSIHYSPNGMSTEPQKFATPLPVMPKYDGNEARKKKRKEMKK